MNIVKVALFSGAMIVVGSAAFSAPVKIKLISTTPASASANVTVSPVGAKTGVNTVAQNYLQTSLGAPNLGSFAAFCLDLEAQVGFNTPYDYKTTTDPFSNSLGLSPTQKDRVQAVFDANYGTVLLDGFSSAPAFQLALWEATYEADTATTPATLNVGNGLFQATASFAATANIYLSNALSYLAGPNVRKYNLTFLESDPQGTANRTQNLVTASPVPLPAAGLLLFGALGALGLTSRRQKAASEA